MLVSDRDSPLDWRLWAGGMPPGGCDQKKTGSLMNYICTKTNKKWTPQSIWELTVRSRDRKQAVRWRCCGILWARLLRPRRGSATYIPAAPHTSQCIRFPRVSVPECHPAEITAAPAAGGAGACAHVMLTRTKKGIWKTASLSVFTPAFADESKWLMISWF